MSCDRYPHNTEILSAAVEHVIGYIPAEQLPLAREMYYRFLATGQGRFFFVLYYPDTQKHAECAVEIVRLLFPFVWGISSVRGYGAAPNRLEGKPLVCKVVGHSAGSLCRAEIETAFPTVEPKEQPLYCYLLLCKVFRNLLSFHFERDMAESLQEHYERAQMVEP